MHPVDHSCAYKSRPPELGGPGHKAIFRGVFAKSNRRSFGPDTTYVVLAEAGSDESHYLNGDPSESDHISLGTAEGGRGDTRRLTARSRRRQRRRW